MPQITPWIVFENAILAGLIFGVFIKTGVNINPEDLMIDIIGKIVKVINLPQTTAMWNTMKLALIILGIVSLAIEILLIWSMGWIGIVPAIFGFFGMFLLTIGFAVEFGVVILLIGGFIANLTTKE